MAHSLPLQTPPLSHFNRKHDYFDMSEFCELLIILHTTTGIWYEKAENAMHIRQEFNQSVSCKPTYQYSILSKIRPRSLNGLITKKIKVLNFSTYQQRQSRAWSWTLIDQLLKSTTVCQVRVTVSWCLYQIHLSAILTLLIPVRQDNTVHKKFCFPQET